MIALDSRTRSRLMWVAAMLTPIASVQLLRVLSVTTAQQATAAPAAAPEPSQPPPAPPTLTARQRDAVRWLATQGTQPLARSPMDRPDPPPVETHVAEVKAEPEPMSDDTPRKLRVTGLIGDGKNALAAIDHKLRRVGDTVAPNWTVVRIDSRGRQVVIRHSDGRELTLEPARSGQ